MKKIISLVLALMLICAFCTPAFAAEEKSETLTFDGNTYLKGNIFELSTEMTRGEGWFAGFRYCLTITALPNTHVRITHIDAHVERYGSNFGKTTVSHGTKDPDTEVKDGSFVSIDNVGESELVIGCPDGSISFDEFVIYYECCHVYNRNNICKYCGKDKCDVEGHTLENGFCKFCDFFDESKHEHIYDNNNNCVCGKDKCDVEGHNYVSVLLCDCCGEEAPAGYTGSTLSEGNMSIIVGVASAVVFGFGGFLLGRKKKPTPANVVGNDEE